ncbi:MAG: homoserine kinase [Rhodospirillales bacterium]|nr:homoserine kinase [Rhodospirillales bacterium]
MAVYTEVPDDDLARFVADYDLGEVVSYKGIAEGVENSNYVLKTETGSYILTLYERRVNPADLPFFLGLMDHLAAKAIPCPTPIKARDGKALRELAGRPAAIISFLDGVWPRRITPQHCAELGEAMARFHVAGTGFALSRHNALSVASWRPLLAACASRAHEVKPGLAAMLAPELDWIEREWPTGLPTGVIHADLFPDNVFFRGERLTGMIDFYFACNDILAYDLAIGLNAWCFEADRTFNVTKARRLLAGYRRVRDLVPAEVASLVRLARGSAMRFLLTRLYDWLNTPPDALVRRKDPLEYVEKLRFHQGVKSAADYGFE